MAMSYTQYLINWLRDKKEESKTEGFVVGVSGGVDSAVVLNLCIRAAPDNTYAVLMPCFSSAHSLTDGKAVVDACGVPYSTIPLDAAHMAIFESVKNIMSNSSNQTWRSDTEKMTNGNLRARLRMCTLYTVANNLNYLVVGTDNLPETHMGYFTKYGDGGIDLVPLTHMTKRQVRLMAKDLNVPDTVIKKPATADLFDGQTDEGEMGVSYDELDDYLEGKWIDPDKKAIIHRAHDATHHKRSMPTSPDNLPCEEDFR